MQIFIYCSQVELTENVPLGNRLKQMSSKVPDSSSQTFSRPATSSPTASDPVPSRQHGNRQPSLDLDIAAAVPADRRHDTKLSQAAQSAGKQATARQGPAKRTSAKFTGKAATLPSALQKAIPQAELTPAELKALARRLKAAKQAGQAPHASASDRAVPSTSGPSAAGSSGKAAQGSMGPPAARGKRPPLPDRSMLPPKKRRATQAALPVAQGQPAAAAQGPREQIHASKTANAIPKNKVC